VEEDKVKGDSEEGDKDKEHSVEEDTDREDKIRDRLKNQEVIRMSAWFANFTWIKARPEKSDFLFPGRN